MMDESADEVKQKIRAFAAADAFADCWYWMSCVMEMGTTTCCLGREFLLLMTSSGSWIWGVICHPR